MNTVDHCIDYRGRRIEFPRSAVRHIQDKHSEIDSYLSRICDVLAEPDLVYSRGNTNTHLYYKLGVCSGEFTGRYLVVYVRYNNGGLHIRTAHSTSTPIRGDFLIYDGTNE